jgi:DNA-binding response OmpR family regulator
MEQQHVMLIDDNTDIQAVIQISLEQLGYQVTCFSEGKYALDAIDDLQPQIAIVDFGLPDMDGINVGKTIRDRLGNSVKLIMLSGTSDPDVKQHADEIGFDAFLIKPVRLSVLKSQLAHSS